jgi:hypothetical protein
MDLLQDSKTEVPSQLSCMYNITLLALYMEFRILTLVRSKSTIIVLASVKKNKNTSHQLNWLQVYYSIRNCYKGVLKVHPLFQMNILMHGNWIKQQIFQTIIFTARYKHNTNHNNNKFSFVMIWKVVSEIESGAEKR